MVVLYHHIHQRNLTAAIHRDLIAECRLAPFRTPKASWLYGALPAPHETPGPGQTTQATPLVTQILGQPKLVILIWQSATQVVEAVLPEDESVTCSVYVSVTLGVLEAQRLSVT